MYLSVPVRNENGVSLNELNDCLENYFKEEKIDGDNQIECEKCK